MPSVTKEMSSLMTHLRCQELERREVPSATAALAGNILSVVGDDGDNRIEVATEGSQIVVRDGTIEVFRGGSASISEIGIDARDGRNSVIVSKAIVQPVTIAGGKDRNKFVGGGGVTTFLGGPGRDFFFGGIGANSFNGGDGENQIVKAFPTDVVFANPGDRVFRETLANTATVQETLTADDVETLLKRAAAASASSDAIIVITDRNGQILGVRTESGVSPAITGNLDNLVFAIDGAYAKALTGAYFGNNQAPLTSRTIQFISQSTITQREVEANPNITDPDSTLRGPGFVAPVGTKNHFPPGIAFTPQVDLFQIEHTNRDGRFAPGPDRIIGTADDISLTERFNINEAFVPAGNTLFAPASYGDQSGRRPKSQSRGIATLPGGIPIYKNGQVVGGIGVFFPGSTGFATAENSALSSTFDPTKPDRSLEAEFIAFAAVGGFGSGRFASPIGTLNGVALPAGITGLPSGRIDLVGIQLDIVGPGGVQQGLKTVLAAGAALGVGNPDDGINQPLAGGQTLLPGNTVPEGWLVMPHDGDGVTAEEAGRLIVQGMKQAYDTRAAIRLPAGSRTRMVLAVTDRKGDVIALYRMPDATIFSIDVAVAKARNVMYYADANQLQPVDQVPGIAPGVAFTNRTFRYLGLPRFPEGIDTAPPGPFSQFNDGGVDPNTGLQVGPRLPASAYQSVVGYDAFNPGTNFRQQANQLNQNGIVFFPGSAPVYRNGTLIGGYGISGDGVDQDDVVTFFGQMGFDVPSNLPRADQVFYRGVRLPYQKFNRNPEG